MQHPLFVLFSGSNHARKDSGNEKQSVKSHGVARDHGFLFTQSGPGVARAEGRLYDARSGLWYFEPVKGLSDNSRPIAASKTMIKGSLGFPRTFQV